MQYSAPSFLSLPSGQGLWSCRSTLASAMLCALVLALGFFFPVSAEAQLSKFLVETSNPTAKNSETQPSRTPEDLEALRAENVRALRLAQKLIDSKAEGAPAEKQTEPAAREVELRTQLGYVLDQRKSASERAEQLQARLAELKTDLSELRTTGPKEDRPYSFLLLEQLRDELAAEENRAESISDVLAGAKEARNRAKTLVEEKQSARRKAKESLDTNKSDGASGTLGTALELAELEEKVAQETLQLRDVELRIETLQEELHKQRMTFLQEKLHYLQQDVEFTRADLQDQKLQLEKQQEDLKQALEWAQRRAADLEQRWAEANRTLESQVKKDPAQVEKAEANRIGRQVRAQEVTLLTAQLQRLARAMTVWDQRYSISSGAATAGEIARWQTETENMLEQLEREGRLQSIRQDELRQDLATLEKKVQANQEAPPAVTEAIQEQRMHLERQLRAFDANNASINASRRLHEKLLRELVGDSAQFDLGQWAARFWRNVVDAWNYELTTVEERPITAGKIVSGLVLLLIGVYLSRWMSRLFAERLLRRFGLTENAIPALQTVSFYLLVAVFTLLALRMVNVPLGVLTFLGGAVAIGVGFGSQNILNNFISGLIMLAERPVRVGDLIEIDGLIGRVERIGGRSTRIRNASNLEIIIPNSTFLQNNVVNWSLGNQNVRAIIGIGVAYGSPTREVVRLLKKVADDHGLVLEDPEPIVYFKDFGDSALLFELVFFVSTKFLADRLRIESDLRFMIDSAFRDAGISIPFPQRDLHFDSMRPLEIKMISSEASYAEK